MTNVRYCMILTTELQILQTFSDPKQGFPPFSGLHVLE